MLASAASPSSESEQTGAPQRVPQHEVADGGGRERPSAAVIGAGVLIVLLLGTLIFALNMRRGLNHDEHQFVAGGALIVQGLQPYRDFAWFHVPGLAWLYAFLFGTFDHLLLTARMVSIIASTGTLALLMGVALWRLDNWRPWSRLGVGSLTLLLLIATPAYSFASGRAWNHDVAVFLALASFVLLIAALGKAVRGKFGVAQVVCAGLLLGLSASTRLTMAPLALPFVLAPLCWGLGWGRTLRFALWFALGMTAGLAAIWYSLLTAPDAFFFGNLRYAALNTEWYAARGADISLWGKLTTTVGLLVQPGNLILLALTAAAFWRARRAFRTGAGELRFWLITLPFLLLGALAATPMQVQYLFALFPFAALGFLLALGHQTPARWLVIALGIGALVATVLAAPRYVEGLAVLPSPAQWYPNKIHNRGAFIKAMMAAESDPDADALLFTLSPILPLEGNVRFDPRTATGPFGWRVAELLSPEERTEYALLGAGNLAAALVEDNPRAILTAMHSDDEVEGDAALEGWASEQGFVAVPMPDEGTLWLSPLARWGTIRLGAQTFPQRVAPGETVHGTLYLQSDAPTATNLNLLLRAVNQHGEELFRFEGWPFGSATSSWKPGALWQDGHEFAITESATQGIYRIEASFYDPATLESVGESETIGWLVVEGELSEPVARFGDVVQLVRVDAQDVAHAGETLTVTPHWRFMEAPEFVPSRFAHLVDASGNVVAQADRPLLADFAPPTEVMQGAPIVDTIDLPLPADLAPGEYTLLIGLYNPVDGARLLTAEGGDSVEVVVVIE